MSEKEIKKKTISILLINIMQAAQKCMDDNADAILLASSPVDWRRQLGRPRITWLSSVQQDLKQHHLKGCLYSDTTQLNSTELNSTA